MRYGWFDAVLARYALALTPDLEALLVTHVDTLARRGMWRVASTYELSSPDAAGERGLAPGLVDAEGASILGLVADPAPTLVRQACLTTVLDRRRPVLTPLPTDETANLGALEALLSRRIDVVSRGPSARHVMSRG